MSDCATSAPPCKDVITGQMAKLGCEVIVSTAPPIFPTPYEPAAFRCPHGVLYYLEPSPEQIIRWREAGVE